ALAYLDLADGSRADQLRRLMALIRVGRLVDAERLTATLGPLDAEDETCRAGAALLRFLRGDPIAGVAADLQARVLASVDPWSVLSEQPWADVPAMTDLLLKVVRGETPALAVLSALGQRYFTLGDHDRAIACFRGYAARAEPGDRAAILWLGSLLC